MALPAAKPWGKSTCILQKLADYAVSALCSHLEVKGQLLCQSLCCRRAPPPAGRVAIPMFVVDVADMPLCVSLNLAASDAPASAGCCTDQSTRFLRASRLVFKGLHNTVSAPCSHLEVKGQLLCQSVCCQRAPTAAGSVPIPICVETLWLFDWICGL